MREARDRAAGRIARRMMECGSRAARQSVEADKGRLRRRSAHRATACTAQQLEKIMSRLRLPTHYSRRQNSLEPRLNTTCSRDTRKAVPAPRRRKKVLLGEEGDGE